MRFTRIALPMLGIALLCLLAVPAAAAVLEGRVSLTVDGKPLRAEEAREAVVYFRAPGLALPPASGDFEMRTEGKQFSPRALPVPVGATVRFPNFDPILHNVFSSTGAAKFDLGLYGRGEGRSHTFDAAGLVRVYCNVHHDMVAHILVLDTPHFAHPDAEGHFRLDLPDGVAGEVFVWHERAKLWRQAIDGKDVPPLAIDLELSRPRVPPHTNKFGKPYGDDRAPAY